ncbi:MAG TPA: sialidase family protein [Candidatus Thermoplasmatota archaeon]
MLSFRAGALAIILVGVVFAGCLTNDAPTSGDQFQPVQKRPAGAPVYISEQFPEPVLKCYDGNRCNQEMTPDDGRQGNEVTIAVDPTNPKNIVGGAKDYYPPDAGECVWDGVYVTHDGGATTYEDRSFDGSPWRALQDPTTFQPNYASQYWCTTDPVVYFNTAGTFYYLLMAYQGDPVTGSKTGEELPGGNPPGWPGALNDFAFNRAVQIVAVSDDGGDTFHTFTPVLEGTFPVNFHDKGWLAASADGTIHVMWLSVVAGGNLYFRSTDGGETYPPQDMEVLAPFLLGGGQGSFLDVGTGDEVYAIWGSGGGVTMRRSMDTGETWDEARTVFDTTGRNMPGLSPRDRVRGGFPALASDRFADSPYADNLYIAWTDGRYGDATDILFSASTDKGDSWTEPIVLNDDYLPNGTVDPNNWQFFATVGVSPLGVIDVSWVDTRNVGTGVLLDNNGGSPDLVGQEHLKLDQYHTYSLDGGKTWSQNFRVRDIEDGGWDPQFCHHQNGMIFIGDYNDIDSSVGAAHPVWPDTRSGNHCDVYTAIVQRPIFPEDFSEEKKAEWRQKLVSEGLVDADHPFLN